MSDRFIAEMVPVLGGWQVTDTLRPGVVWAFGTDKIGALDTADSKNRAQALAAKYAVCEL